MAADPRSRSERACGFAHFVFDLDGTLVDSADDLVAATNVALVRLGLGEQNRGVILGFVGHGVRRLLESSIESVAPGRAAELVEPALAAFREHYAANLLARTRPYAGVPETLAALAHRGAVLSVLTNKPRQFASAILAGLGLDRWLVQLVAGDDAAARKPDPAGAQALVRASGVARDSSVLVGDSAVDVATARAAGLASCAVAWGFTPLDVLLAAHPDLVVRQPGELLSLCDA